MKKLNVDEIKELLKKKVLIERLELEKDEVYDISDDESLFDENGLALDSVEALDIVTGISDIFGLDTSKISQDDLSSGFQTINQIATYIENELK
ncbi:acyl-carrier protein [Lactococcus cremoris]|uniref:Acyl-carrier protein n=1 Tax=Lactococcus lactis subsp. cremoris TaxID=1359 RepID=A0A166KJ35_LACLC|nr:phosphopantetheine-binding protein [Lactococcus cremoris]KZK08430.1 acyl-carrier protein [Lactococcus cremoris]